MSQRKSTIKLQPLNCRLMLFLSDRTLTARKSFIYSLTWDFENSFKVIALVSNFHAILQAQGKLRPINWNIRRIISLSSLFLAFPRFDDPRHLSCESPLIIRIPTATLSETLSETKTLSRAKTGNATYQVHDLSAGGKGR